MSVESTEQPVAAKGLSRRVIVKSAAWSVPVFTAVGVTPAFAASSGLVLEAASTVSATRGSSGNAKQRVTFPLTITANTAITITRIVYTENRAFTVTTSGAPTTLNGNGTITFVGRNSPASDRTVPSVTVTVNFLMNGQPDYATFTVAGLGSSILDEGDFATLTVTSAATNPTF